MDKLPNEHLSPEAFGNEILTSGIDTEHITSRITPQVARFLRIIKGRIHSRTGTVGIWQQRKKIEC
jgi:hypothetical protein